jgi:hypothetical protein
LTLGGASAQIAACIVARVAFLRAAILLWDSLSCAAHCSFPGRGG